MGVEEEARRRRGSKGGSEGLRLVADVANRSWCRGGGRGEGGSLGLVGGGVDADTPPGSSRNPQLLDKAELSLLAGGDHVLVDVCQPW